MSWLQVPRLRFVGSEKWDSGETVRWREVPFPPCAKTHFPWRWFQATTRVASVPLRKLCATQSRVTEHGLEKYRRGFGAGNLPLVYARADGTYEIHDGHHRLVAAMLRGVKSARVRVVPTVR